jgi:hypothetical protein
MAPMFHDLDPIPNAKAEGDDVTVPFAVDLDVPPVLRDHRLPIPFGHDTSPLPFVADMKTFAIWIIVSAAFLSRIFGNIT